MSGVRDVRDVRDVRGAAPTDHAAPGDVLVSILPPVGAGVDASTALVALRRAVAQLRDNKVDLGQSDVVANQELGKKAAEDALEALLEKIEAEDDAGGFWSDLASVAGDIAKWAGAAASVALAVASCGAGTAVAVLAITGAALSTAATVNAETKLLERLGVDPELAGYINLGASLAGAACSGGAGLAASGTNAAAAGAMTRAVRVGGHVGTIASSSASAVGAGAEMVVAGFVRDAQRAHVDALSARGAERRYETRTDEALQTVKDAVEGFGRRMRQVNEAMSAHNAARVNMVRA